jgi:citrate synthase
LGLKTLKKKWETTITKVTPNELLIRGYPLDELIGSISYAAGIYLLLKGDLPSSGEENMINAILVSTMDHGVTAPSAVTARTVASSGVPITTAMGAGILSIGDHHGGAGEMCMKYLRRAFDSTDEEMTIPEIAQKVVTDSRTKKERIPGFGHRFHKADPRTTKLIEIANNENIGGKFLELAQQISIELSTQSGKKLPLNVDGAIGAILGDMGFKADLGKAFFAIARISGITAHILEEFDERPVRTIIPDEARYSGPKKRNN